MRIKLIVCALVFSCLVCRPVQEKTTVSDAAEAIDFVVAEKYFQEARRICDEDGGKLWGRSLYGPMIFVDRATLTVVANQGDVEGNLTKKGPVFVGRLPADIPAANTAINWGGVHWSMIFWDALAEDQYDRDRLMIHESFHRIQDELGLRASNPTNNHLDSMAGRLWLQLEWRALNRALSRRGLERNEAVKDALIFRLYRRALFPRATAEEAALEMNEGLAEYTGVKFSGRPDK